MHQRTLAVFATALAALGCTAPAARAADHPEVEPNETRPTATALAAPLVPGDSLSGVSTGSSPSAGEASLDLFLIETAAAPPAIYRHRLTRTSSAPNAGTLRGLNQSNGVVGTTDVTLQTAAGAPPFVQWYGFGKGEMLYFRVTGAATTTAPYQWTFSTTTVTPQATGTFTAGEIVITTVGQGHSTDTDLWVYDADFNAVPTFGNDDESVAGGGTGATTQSRLRRTYAPGTYYLALTNFQFANDQPAPVDDDFRSGVVLDFPDAAANSSATTGLNLAFRISDSVGNALPVAATKSGAFDVLWFSFVVVAAPSSGGCCFGDGVCLANQSAADCANAGGAYQGDGSGCVPNPCPPPGACCFEDGSCEILSSSACATAGGSYRGHGSACSACDGGCCLPGGVCSITSSAACAAANGEFRGFGSNCALPCGCFAELEDNNTKAAANAVQPPLADADCLVGVSTGASTTAPGNGSADYFKVHVAPRPLGIYRHRLTYQSATAAHVATLRGVTQTLGMPNAGTDVTSQTAIPATTPPRYVQWYGFGKGEMLFFRVAGVPTSTAPYTCTLASQPVIAQDLGTFNAGDITLTTIGQGHATDTELWVYDAQLNAIAGYGNDDESIAGGGAGTTVQSLLTRSYAPGVYYIALADFNLQNNLGNPPDDDARSDPLLDFPDVLVNSSPATNVNCTFSIIDSNGTLQVPATRVNAFDVLWFRFTVAVIPPFGACCFSDGTCLGDQAAADCANAGGAYQGNGSDCAPNPCPQPGACCLDPAPCQVLTAAQCAAQSGTYLGDGTSCSFCDCFEETENNDSKLAANATPPLADGACLSGTSTGSSTTVPGGESADYYKVTLAPRPLGIYRHRLEVLSDTPGHIGSIQGLLQSDGLPTAGSDTAVLTAAATTSPPGHVQWYGFGRGEMFYFRVVGTPTTTAPYTYVLSSQAVTPLDVGDFVPGDITITTAGQGHATDTDLWVYDESLNALAGFGNDNAGGPQSTLTRSFAVGRYYLALGDHNLANHLGSPADDDLRSAAVLDFPDLLVGGLDADAAGTNVAFAIIDANGATPVPAAYLEGGWEVRWFTFEVGDLCPGERGDVNCDGNGDFFDIDPFLLALFDQAAYLATYCGGNVCAADIDCSGGINFFDIDPFLNCLFNDCLPVPPTCP